MPSWLEAEKSINKEIEFLKNNILDSPYKQNDAISCRHCLFRQIAMLIVSGNIKLSKVSYSQKNIFGNIKNFEINIKKKHGSIWHSGMINELESYFSKNGYETEIEKSLHYGRCDIFVSRLNTYFEIGTINVYKLYINLLNLKNCDIVIIPDNNYLLVFSL